MLFTKVLWLAYHVIKFVRSGHSLRRPLLARWLRKKRCFRPYSIVKYQVRAGTGTQTTGRPATTSQPRQESTKIHEPAGALPLPRPNEAVITAFAGHDLHWLFAPLFPPDFLSGLFSGRRRRDTHFSAHRIVEFNLCRQRYWFGFGHQALTLEQSAFFPQV